MSEDSPKVVLIIAGFDPSSGAGITADIKTVAAHRLYGAACITALTVQSTQGVRRVEPLDPRLVRETLEALVSDLQPAAVKIGMLGSGEVATAVADFIDSFHPPNVVLDPVSRSSSGTSLVNKAGFQVLQNRLLRQADVVTPNLDEAGLLVDMALRDPGSMEQAARALLERGTKAVVITGGHLPEATDLLAELLADGEVSLRSFRGERIKTGNTHGTGCAFSTSLACGLAGGLSLPAAVEAAKLYVTGALRNSYAIGKGVNPVNHAF